MKRTVALPLVAATMFIWAASAAEVLAPLPLELPPPVFASWIFDPAPRPNVEPYPKTLRPPFLAQVGITNLARGKPVTSSDPNPVSGQLKQITDGGKEACRESLAELHRGTQWVQIDLGAPARLAAVTIWHAHHEPVICYDVVVQAANDPEFKEGVTTLFNNDRDNSSGLGAGEDPMYLETNEGRLIDARGAKARYVRLYSRSSTFTAYNPYMEVEAWGRAE
ncbi:MAG: hypothetical protein H7A45_00120 [Verrucomicrobiales bacterium]|nr:hypothetical protein [Verrucomicrobiales bacterium]MCP5524920.1 hypothetical protein [Verrucomicrobiales bacterium]